MSEQVLPSMTGTVPVTPGQLTGPVRVALASGHCHSLAVAVHEHTGWEVLARTDAEHRDRIDHVAVLTPEGRLLDSLGCHPFDRPEDWTTIYPAGHGGRQCDRSYLTDLTLDWPFDLDPDLIWELDLLFCVLEQRLEQLEAGDYPAADAEPRLEPVERAADGRLPVTELDRVAHIGTLDAADKGTLTWSHSYEGHGLSVSVHPDEWEQIAQLGGLPWWQLTRPDGRFLDAVALTAVQRQQIIDWGVDRGLVQIREQWMVARYDDELEDTMLTAFDSREDALEEADLMELDPSAVSRRDAPVATGTLTARTGAPDGEDAFDHLVVVWVEDTQPDLDGVWWWFELAPMSAPAGTILPAKLDRWTREPIRPGRFHPSA